MRGLPPFENTGDLALCSFLCLSVPDTEQAVYLATLVSLRSVHSEDERVVLSSSLPFGTDIGRGTGFVEDEEIEHDANSTEGL